MTFPSSKWKIKAVQSSLLPPFSVCVITALHSIILSLGAVVERLFPMSLFGFKSPFIKPWLCLKQKLFFCLFTPNIYQQFMFYSWLIIKKKCLFLFSLALASCLLAMMSQSNQWKTIINWKKKKRESRALVNGAHRMCVSLFLAPQFCDIYWKRLTSARFCIYLFHFLQVESSGTQFCDFFDQPPLLSLTSYSIGVLSWLMTSGC